MNLIREGLRNNVVHSITKRKFRILVDPACIGDLTSNSYYDILQLIIDLSLLQPPINFHLLTPAPLSIKNDLFEAVHFPSDSTRFTPSSMSEEDNRKRLLDKSEHAARLGKLCAMAIALKVDAVVTNEPDLIACQYDLYQYDLIKVLPLNEFSDFVEICAHGLGIFWSTSYSNALTQDVYYVLAHPKASKLGWWYHSFTPGILSTDVHEELRSLILNRYPFLLYGRDMVRFFQIQRDSKHQSLEDFAAPLSYHVNAFYLLLWGMLDHLCLLANIVFKLGIKPHLCGIRSSTFLNSIKANRPNFHKFISLTTVSEWIDLMADFRHAAAHKLIPMPTKLAAETEDFRKTDSEILEIIKTSNPQQFATLEEATSPEMRKVLEDLYVFTWRRGAVRHIADHVVLLRGKQGTYWRSPVISIDHDLNMLTGVVDGFLVALFNNIKPAATQ